MKLDVKAFTLTVSIFWGVSLFIITWWIIFLDGPSTDPTFIGRIYRGYTLTPLGSFVGLVWALIDGAIGGAIFALIYNCFTGRKTETV